MCPFTSIHNLHVELFSRAARETGSAEIGASGFHAALETGSDPTLVLIVLVWVCIVDIVMALYVHRQPQRWRKTPDQVQKETMHGIFEEKAVQVIS